MKFFTFLVSLFAIGWFISEYKLKTLMIIPPCPYTRYCAMDDYTSYIEEDGGKWVESEVLGNSAVVKVRASTTTLALIADDPLIRRIPLNLLTTKLSELTLAQRTAVKNRILAMGYTVEEFNERIPDLRNATLGDVLRFAATRRIKPRYDPDTQQIVLDGSTVSCKSITIVDESVEE